MNFSIKTTYMLLVHLALHAIVYEMSLRVLKFAVSHSRGQGSTQGTKQEEVGSISYNGPWHIITFFVPLSPTGRRGENVCGAGAEFRQ